MNSDNRRTKINPLSPNAEENEIPLYITCIITCTCSNIQVKRVRKVITEDKMP